jgi:hypothetical protein
MLYKARGDLLTDRRFFFDLILCPNAELHDVLKFFRKIMPSVIIAKRVGSEIVLFRMVTAMTVGVHMISLPTLAYLSPAYMATPPSLCEYSAALRS